MVADPLQGELPADLDPARLLEVEDASSVAGRAGSFDFVLCRDALRASPYPMALLSELWRVAAPGGVLLLEAAVLPETERSVYARFTPLAGGSAGWTPGRLALRWMVESCGFDVDCWLGDANATGPRAHLRATRAERRPAHSAP